MPGVEGKIEAAWVNGPSITSSVAAVTGTEKSDQADLGDAMASLSRGYDDEDVERDDGAGDDRVVDMDYEMPGEEEHW